MHNDINPVLSGFHPDPSVCRVGDEYVMVTSTFAYQPGLPVHRSRNLIDWELIGHVLPGTAARHLDGYQVSDGVWAPTIRHREGTFYVVFTVARDRRGVGTFVTTATDPAGPWTTPQLLEADGIDPSLFFDDDGRCWFTATRDAADPLRTGPAEVWLREFNTQTLSLVGPEHILWHGAVRGQWVEAPRIFRRDGRYHLIAAEGGTERYHAVTAAVADTPTGPYQTDRRSPLLTHRHLGASAHVQNVGHVDLVDTPDGESWALGLGVRVLDGVHNLGREVFLVPVTWEEDGPVFAPGSGVVPSVRPIESQPPTSLADWITLRGPVAYDFSGADLVLPARPEPLSSSGRPALVARRQDRHVFTFEATVERAIGAEGEAGLTAFLSETAFVTVAVSGSAPRAVLEVTEQGNHGRTVLARRPVAGQVRLAIRSDGMTYRLGMVEDGSFTALASVSHRNLSTEVVGGFVGVVVGMFHTDRPEAGTARFIQVDYGSLSATPTPAAMTART